MGTLGGEEAFFLGVLDVAEAGGDFAGEDSEELRVIVTGELLDCRMALAMMSVRDGGLLTITSPTISTSSSVTVCSRSLAGEGFWGLGISSSTTEVGGVDSR